MGKEYEDKAKYTCDTGYAINNKEALTNLPAVFNIESVITCQKDGTWTAEDQCKGLLTSSLPRILHWVPGTYHLVGLTHSCLTVPHHCFSLFQLLSVSNPQELNMQLSVTQGINTTQYTLSNVRLDMHKTLMLS